MKKIFKNIGYDFLVVLKYISNHILGILRLLLEIVLLIIGFFVFGMVAILGVIYTFVKHIIKGDYSIRKQLVPIVRSINLAQDGVANAAGGELLNDALKIPEGNIRYGQWFETISAMSGLLFQYVKDTWLRRFLDKAFSIFEKNHCTNAITRMQEFYYKNNR